MRLAARRADTQAEMHHDGGNPGRWIALVSVAGLLAVACFLARQDHDRMIGVTAAFRTARAAVYPSAH